MIKKYPIVGGGWYKGYKEIDNSHKNVDQQVTIFAYNSFSLTVDIIGRYIFNYKFSFNLSCLCY